LPPGLPLSRMKTPELHINVGLAALARGFLTFDVFAQAMSALAQRTELSVRDLWLAPGRLDEQQLGAVLDSMRPRDTMLAEQRSPRSRGTGAPEPVEKIAIARAATGLVEMIGARYRKLHVLGSGGLGEVAACEDSVLRRTVAVKLGHAEAGATTLILEREARIISKLEHPNIIPVYDAGTDA